MTGKYRRHKADRRKGGRVEQPGRNYLQFAGIVLGHVQTYDKGGRTYIRIWVNLPISLRGGHRILP